MAELQLSFLAFIAPIRWDPRFETTRGMFYIGRENIYMDMKRLQIDAGETILQDLRHKSTPSISRLIRWRARVKH